jgi:hypothetical protein
MRQEKSLTEWVNAQFTQQHVPVEITALADLSNGVVFVKLIEV